MTTEAAITAFGVVFGIFVVATMVLIVLVLRFTFQRAAVARGRWPAGREVDESGDGEDGGDGEEDGRPLSALVFAGGGTRGAVQIGMLQVLAEHGFVPDRIYGASVGAVNGAGFAGDPTTEGVERMARIWTGLSREDVYPQGRLHGPWLYFQQRDSVYPNSGLRKIIEDGVLFERLEDSPIPIEVVATSLVDGRERWFTYGPAVDAILASAALPAIFPPVEIDGERYIDGGVVNNVPIQRAIDAGAKLIVVLLCSPPVFEPARARRPVEAVLNALFIAVNARFPRDMSQIPPGVDVILCAGENPEGDRAFGDFSTTAELIAEGRREAAEVVRRYGLGSPGPGVDSAATPPARAAERDTDGRPGPPGEAPLGTVAVGAMTDENGSSDLPGPASVSARAPTTEGSRRRLRFRRSADRGPGPSTTPSVPSAPSGPSAAARSSGSNGSAEVVPPAPVPSVLPVSAPGSGGPATQPDPGT